MIRRTAIFVILCLFFSASGPGSAPDAIPQDWHEAWRSFGVDPHLAEAVVWPEFERYDGLRDMLETAAVYGASFTPAGEIDMSIGLFQMKPSFVEGMEKAWMESGLEGPCELRFDVSGSPSSCRERISRMRKDEWQVIYLGIFLRLLYHAYGSFDSAGRRIQDGLETLPLRDQVQLAANAYNRGCEWFRAGCGNPDLLRVNLDKETFPRILIPSERKRQYSYSALAWEHYKLSVGKTDGANGLQL
ncbi:MAG: hypothetical protein J5737_04495 [Bacteroidales bacterium]|nr:hypothetical protein [Bacteroidales bacterium]